MFMAAGDDLAPAGVLPRVLIVSRRCVRKNKFVDFVGEYHLDLIVQHGGVPVIVPRVAGINKLLDNFEPIHGVLLCEGEDIDASLYNTDSDSLLLSDQELEEIRRAHASDTSIDKEKDNIELRLAKLCLERKIPYLGICRGSQVLNVACGGTLYQDIGKELMNKPADGGSRKKKVKHIDYDNYDGHRHGIKIVKNTPLHDWFEESLGVDYDGNEMEILVNSYHHQGVKRLAARFVAMGFAEDGLIEGFYDPDMYDPEQGRFLVGLQFHPERMRDPSSDEFDYPGCPFVYKEFLQAATAYKKKTEIISKLPKLVNQQPFCTHETLEKKRKLLTFPSIYSPAAQKDIYVTAGIHLNTTSAAESDNEELIIEADYCSSNLIHQTVRNGGFSCIDYRLKKLDHHEENEMKITRKIMEMMSIEQLNELMGFYHMMGRISSDVLEMKMCGVNCN